jgi:hypothetical protein
MLIITRTLYLYTFPKIVENFSQVYWNIFAHLEACSFNTFIALHKWSIKFYVSHEGIHDACVYSLKIEFSEHYLYIISGVNVKCVFVLCFLVFSREHWLWTGYRYVSITLLYMLFKLLWHAMQNIFYNLKCLHLSDRLLYDYHD